jgi:ABC-type glycerol-3-phosphate transport system substrate-binding protein
MTVMLKRLLLTLFTLLILSLGLLTTTAQANTIITLAMPQYIADAAYNDAYFEPFYAANPGVQVRLVTDDGSSMYPSSPAFRPLEEYLADISAYTSSADVLLVFDNPAVSIESTRAGYWLDIAPLVAADPDLAADKFYPPAWNAFRWDGGLWALPSNIRLNLLTYDRAALDAAGVSYPSENWTIQDFINAAMTLAQKDANGNVIRAGCFCDDEMLLYSLLRDGFTGDDASPRLDTPELAALLDTWVAAFDQMYPGGNMSSQGVPILMTGTYTLVTDAPVPYTIGQMPGNVTKAYVEGFAVSAGTAHPELAFALAKFLALNPRTPYGDPSLFPAIRGAAMTSATEVMRQGYAPETQAVIQAALETAVSPSEFLYTSYIFWAQNAMREQGIDAQTALQQAQAAAVANLEAAAAWTGADMLTVATPAPAPAFGADEIVLNFGVSMGILYNQNEWQRVADEFAAADPQVGQVVINTQGMSYDSFMSSNDCYHLTYDAVDPQRIADYINLDPFMDADPAFRREDFLPGTLEAMQLDGRTWGYPLSVTTTVLVYDPATFNRIGIPLPGTSWTVSEFADAVNALQNSDLGIPALSPRQAENADYLLLIAAYGGLPIDYRTDPPTINFTDPNTVDAVRQVLDLAKNGAINYRKLGTFQYTDMPGPGAISPTDLGGYADYVRDYGKVNFPQGGDYQTMAIGDVGGMYISNHAQNPDACYRWMATVAAHPELLPTVMPANAAAINHPNLAAAQGNEVVATYQELARLMRDPNTIQFQSGFGGGGNYSLEMFFVNQWLNRAFDAYVLDGGDLTAALADAQRKADNFLACTDNLPPVDSASAVDALAARSDGVIACMASVDPDMAAERLAAMPTP